MQYTENHSLPQWEAADPIQRGDFNTAMESIDAALGVLNSAVGGKANQSDLAAVSETVTTLAGRKIARGTFKGNGGTQTISVGFTPTVVLVSCSAINGAPAFMAFQGTPGGAMTVVDGGFSVVSVNNYSFNSASSTYLYLALQF